MQTADLIVGTIACAYGAFVAVLAITRWELVANSRKGRLITRWVGERRAPWCYACFGVVLIGLGVWVLLG